MSAKINLSLIDQAAILPNEDFRAHLMQQTPDVKSGKMCVSSFNGALAAASFGKSVDPTCYNVCVGGNHAAALFDMVRK